MIFEISFIPGFMVGITFVDCGIELGLGIVYVFIDWGDDGPR